MNSQTSSLPFVCVWLIHSSHDSTNLGILEAALRFALRLDGAGPHFHGVSAGHIEGHATLVTNHAGLTDLASKFLSL